MSKIEQQIENAFIHHVPKPGQPEIYGEIRQEAKEFARLIFARCPDSQELSLALTRLEEVTMWANAAIARHG